MRMARFLWYTSSGAGSFTEHWVCLELEGVST